MKRRIDLSRSFIRVHPRYPRFYLLFFFLCGAAAPPVPITPAAAVKNQWVHYDLLRPEDGGSAKHVETVIRAELARYRPSFLENAGLKAIWLARRLTVANQNRAAVVLQSRGIVVLDVYAPESRNYLRHAFHHEFYHLAELTTAGDFYFKDPRWAALNPPRFTYGSGGRFEQDSAKDPGALVHPIPGFVDKYAASGIEEDKAEVFACLMLPDEQTLLDTWSRTDDALAKKAKWQREFLAWWSTRPSADPQATFMKAVADDDAPTVEKLLAAHPGLVRKPAWDSWLPPHWAAAHGATRCLPVLIKASTPDLPDADGWTPLHTAAAAGQPVAAHELLNLGADPTMRDKFGQTPADRARAAGHPNLAKLLSPKK